MIFIKFGSVTHTSREDAKEFLLILSIFLELL